MDKLSDSTRAMDIAISPLHRLKHLLKTNQLNVFMYFLLVVICLLSLGIGRFPIPVKVLLTVVYHRLFDIVPDQYETISHIIFNIRLPRVLAAVITGSCLATSGAALQGTFKNPMVSPGLLGVASGSAFGAALGILLNLSAMGTQILSFASGMLTVFIVYLISTIISRDNQSSMTLILLGMVTSSIFTSMISLLKYVADPYDTLPAITFWLMGSLSQVDYASLTQILLPVAMGLIILWTVRWKITLLSFGEEEATALGLNYKFLRFLVITAATMITASVVSISGLIGFVGLIVPHMARLIVGPNYNKLIPASIALGGIFLLIIDNLSRSLLAAELPLGILTSIIGAPFFLFLLASKLRRH